jgi:Arc/MetJ-type ribon-helix-helix transcriptional regulator
MEKMLTIRLNKEQDQALTRRAKALGKTRSEVVRELIERGLDEEPLGRRIAHLKGVLNISNSKDPARRRIKQRNWR